MRRNPDTGAEHRLRDLLRRGDPAADDAHEIPAPALPRMRGRILSAAAGSPRLRVVPFAWATAMAAGILVLLALAIRFDVPAPSSAPSLPEPPSTAVVPLPRPVGVGAGAPELPRPALPLATADPAAPAASPHGKGASVAAGARPRSAPLPGTPTEAPPAVRELAASDPAEALAAVATPARRAPLNVQFTTPAGTRIIWTLDPEFSG